ncbi:MAG: T9SS type A sorting domain-containing protein, partial [Bacteroidetes bacterium]|nr:T9SS type A sorting domain-containing protein [Bacteroidota bacterium]
FTKIQGVLVEFCYGTGTGTAEVAVWDNSGASGEPGAAPIVTETIEISDVLVDIGNMEATYIAFSPFVEIPGPFYAGVILPTVFGDTLVLFSNSNGDTDPGIAWEQWSDDSWHTIAATWGVNEAIAIYPVVNDEGVTISYTDVEDFVTVFPNPANTHFTVMSSSTIERIRIVDIIGRTVLEQAVGNGSYRIETADFRNGMYLLEVETANGITISKVQVMK